MGKKKKEVPLGRRAENEKPNRQRSILLAAVCGGVIAIVLLGSFFGLRRDFSENENRLLAEAPEARISSILDGSFESEFELFAQDHIFMRDAFMGIKSVCDKAIGKPDNGSVYYGSNGYLFAIETIDEERLAKNAGYAAEFISAHPELDTHVMVVPTATEILKTYLPKNAECPDETAAIAQIKDLLTEEGAEKAFIDVTETLAEHANEYIYYRTDHHWTSLGAYYAFDEYAKSINAAGDFTVPKYDIVTVSDEFRGTNYSKCIMPLSEKDKITRFDSIPDKPALSAKMSLADASGNITNELEGCYDDSYLEVKDKYSYFLSGNNPVTVIEPVYGSGTSAAENGGRRLLVIKDSYANCFIPFLTDCFDCIVAADLRYMRGGLDDILEEYGITDVLILYNVLNFASDTNIAYLNN